MITVKIEVNGITVGKITAVNTAQGIKDGKHLYSVMGRVGNYKKGRIYDINQLISLKQYGSSPMFVSDLMREVNNIMKIKDDEYGQAGKSATYKIC